MEERDFLYHYSNIYLTEVIKDTILIENWAEGDFGRRYLEYPDQFLKLKSICFSEGVTDDGITARLEKARNIAVARFNKDIKKRFTEELGKHNCSQNVADELISKENVFLDDSINPDALKIFRRLEERIYSQKKGEV